MYYFDDKLVSFKAALSGLTGLSVSVVLEVADGWPGMAIRLGVVRHGIGLLMGLDKVGAQPEDGMGTAGKDRGS